MSLTASQSAQRRRANIRALIITAVILLVLFAWTQNTFDNFLWKVGLNHSDCIQNGFGATFCGDTAKKYEHLVN